MRIARISFLFLLITLGMASCGAWAQALEKSKITLAVGGSADVVSGAYEHTINMQAT